MFDTHPLAAGPAPDSVDPAMIEEAIALVRRWLTEAAAHPSDPAGERLAAAALPNPHHYAGGAFDINKLGVDPFGERRVVLKLRADGSQRMAGTAYRLQLAANGGIEAAETVVAIERTAAAAGRDAGDCGK